MKWSINHDIHLKTLGIDRELTRKGKEIELTKKQVDEIHDKLSQSEDYKKLVPVFERIED